MAGRGGAGQIPTQKPSCTPGRCRHKVWKRGCKCPARRGAKTMPRPLRPIQSTPAHLQGKKQTHQKPIYQVTNSQDVPILPKNVSENIISCVYLKIINIILLLTYVRIYFYFSKL